MRTVGFALVLGLGMVLSAGGCDCGRITSIAPELQTPAAATATVAGGVKARSPNFQLITTTSAQAGAPASPSFTVRTGVVGATQSAASAEAPQEVEQ